MDSVMLASFNSFGAHGKQAFIRKSTTGTSEQGNPFPVPSLIISRSLQAISASNPRGIFLVWNSGRVKPLFQITTFPVFFPDSRESGTENG